MKKLISFAITATITLATATTAFAQTFTDVPTNHWAYTAIEKAVDNGAVKGVGNGKYNPNQEVTNAEWIKMVVNIFWVGIERDPYNNKVWWHNDTNWAYTCRFLDNTKLYTQLQNSQSSDWGNYVLKPINRYEMAQIVYNIANHPDKDINLNIQNVNTSGIANKISDYKSIPSQYRDAVEFCYASGLITGVDNNGTFAGTQPMTRASSAVVLNRLLDAKAGKWVVPTTTASNTTSPSTTVAVLDVAPLTPVTPVIDNSNTTPAVANPTAVADMIKVNNGDKIKNIAVNNSYIPGKLANGKDITPENIDAMFAEIKTMFPDETSWGGDASTGGKNDGQKYRYTASNPTGYGGGCLAYAGMVCDTIFGRGAKWTQVADMNQMKKGDLVIKKDAQGTIQHVIVITDVYTVDGITCYNVTDGNNNAKVNWDGKDDVNSLLIMSPKSELYTAY